MRNPKRAVARIYGLQEIGAEIREDWASMVRHRPVVMETAKKYGTRDCQVDQEALEQWKGFLEKYLKAEAPTGFTVKENWEFRSPLNSELWDGWHRTTGDPENCIGLWAREAPRWEWMPPYPHVVSSPEVEIDEADFEDLPELEVVKEKRKLLVHVWVGGTSHQGDRPRCGKGLCGDQNGGVGAGDFWDWDSEQTGLHPQGERRWIFKNQNHRRSVAIRWQRRARVPGGRVGEAPLCGRAILAQVKEGPQRGKFSPTHPTL